VALSLKPEHLKRYTDIARLLFKYGRGDLARHAGLAELLPVETTPDPNTEIAARDIARDLEKLGPTFIKLGQLLSTRPDIVPPAYAEALTRLQNNCEPFPFSQVEEILTEELGVRPSKAFERIEPTPIAAASIAQVHYAVMRDGQEVAIKVQRPGIREQVLTDLDALCEIARFLEQHTDFAQRFGVAMLLDEFRKTLLRELDFRQEAIHLLALGADLAEVDEIVIPQPLQSYSTARVLTMEFIAGTKITALSPVARLEIDGERLADALFRAYLIQMMRTGLFHADPHPGNVFVVDGKLALIDLGMVARIPPYLQERLLQLLVAVTDDRPDDAAKVLLQLARAREGADARNFQRGVADILGQHQMATAVHPQVGRVVLMLMKVAADNGYLLPPEFAMIGKTLLNLDKIGHTLAPRFDPNAAVRRHAAEITGRQFDRQLSLSALMSTAVELKNFARDLPHRLNRVLDRVIDNEIRIKVDALDEGQLMAGMQKVANRIATGLILAALIVGAAMLMHVETTFRIFGYPGLAILLFIAAAAGGVGLVVSILLSDVRARRK
jgi:predicted unusual protein kinase regulating ubiquinone biosynthesis (AarF/ABC1/UbiB family)